MSILVKDEHSRKVRTVSPASHYITGVGSQQPLCPTRLYLYMKLVVWLQRSKPGYYEPLRFTGDTINSVKLMNISELNMIRYSCGMQPTSKG
jgi:hypothetical protein